MYINDSRRIVLKSGNINSDNMQVEGKEPRHQGYFSDILTTMVEMTWKYNLAIFGLGNIISWFVFAVIWWTINYANGDLNPSSATDYLKSDNSTQCVKNLHSFTAAFFFSIETQTTIGYGFVHLNHECPEIMIVLALQCLVGMLLETLLVGFVIAKLLSPPNRSSLIYFSENAVVCKRDGMPCFMFRVGKSISIDKELIVSMINFSSLQVTCSCKRTSSMHQ
jgi:Inward rectifier potassium channel transmembrane domain/Inward rectifier potassium channel C-terminal domain